MTKKNYIILVRLSENIG